ncbi:MAG TPA: hypothetical protein VGF67_00090 [Ktedonobacteraceae bacterium]|jgi:hypothetical protein
MTDPHILKAITECIRETGQQIQGETDTLKTQTGQLLGQIDATCQQLPLEIYSFLESEFLTWKAFLERSAAERERISTLLGATAEALEKHERTTGAGFHMTQ